MNMSKSSLILALLLFAMPSTSFALQGTCSYHGGVNCSAGSDYDGSAICNDGWRDSSESYSDTVACISGVHLCTTAEFNKLENESQLSTIQAKIDTALTKRTGLESELNAVNTKAAALSNQTDSSNSQLRDNAIKSLQLIPEINRISSEISLNQTETSGYLNEKQSESNRIYKVCSLMGEDEFRQRIYENQLNQIQRITVPVTENICVSRGVPNTHPEGNYCICDIGYLQSGNKCVPLSIESCVALNGTGAIPQQGTNLCQCDTTNGYTPNSSRNGCVSSSATTNSDVVNATPMEQIETKSQNVPIIKEKPANLNAKVEVIATSVATSTVSNGTSISTQNSTPQKKSTLRKILEWFKWW